MAFPINVPVGTTHKIANGTTYEFTDRGVWRILSFPNGARIKYTVSPTAPLNPELCDQWYDTNVRLLKTYSFDGGVFRWFVMGGANGGIGGGAGESAADYVVPLAWWYSSEGFNFERWTDDYRYSWRDYNGTAVTVGFNGDDTLDVVDTNGIKVGNTYVIFDNNGFRQEVVVDAVINKTRLRLRDDLKTDFTTAKNPTLGRTSFSLENGVGEVVDGDVFISKPLFTLRDRDGGRVVIRRSISGTGTFSVQYRQIGFPSFKTAEFIDSRASETGEYRDEFYELLQGGIVEVVVRFTNADNKTAKETLQHMVLFSAPEKIELGRVEKPTNVSPADQATGQSSTPTLVGSPYRSIYGLAQAGSEFQIAADSNFSNIVVNSSSSFLASWVNTAGVSKTYTAVEAYSDGTLVFVGLAGLVETSTDLGKTRTTQTATGSDAIRDAAISGNNLFVCGDTGTIYTSLNKAVTFTKANLTSGFTGTLNGIAAAGSMVIAVGASGQIERSTNGGSFFNRVVAANAFVNTFYDVELLNNGRAIAVGANGTIQTSSNNGETWVQRTAAGNYTGTFRRVILNEDGLGFAVGSNGMIQRTEDYGSTWTIVVPEGTYTGTFYGVDVRDNNVVVVGDNGEIQTSSNKGIIFYHRTPAAAFNATFNQVFILENNAVAVGANSIQRTFSVTGEIGTSYTVPLGTDLLQTRSVYWWRTRYQDSAGYWSSWSDPTAFSTSTEFNYVRQPSNLSPANNATGISVLPTLQSSPFGYIGDADTHDKSQWEVAASSGNFSNPAYQSGDTTDLLSHKLPDVRKLSDRTTYAWRVRHKGKSGRYSSWSTPTTFETQLRPNAPTLIAPTANQENVLITPTLRSSTFSTPVVGNSHAASQWQIATSSTFATIVHDSGETTTALVSYTVPNASALQPITNYFVRVRHRGTGTEWSNWSTEVGFRTGAASGSQNYTSPGTYTFTVPAGVTSVSALAIGAGGGGGYSGGGGGGLVYRNNIAVTPGQTITVTVGSPGTSNGSSGGSSSFGSFITAGGGGGGSGGGGSGGTISGGTGGNGGAGSTYSTQTSGGGSYTNTEGPFTTNNVYNWRRYKGRETGLPEYGDSEPQTDLWWAGTNLALGLSGSITSYTTGGWTYLKGGLAAQDRAYDHYFISRTQTVTNPSTTSYLGGSGGSAGGFYGPGNTGGAANSYSGVVGNNSPLGAAGGGYGAGGFGTGAGSGNAGAGGAVRIVWGDSVAFPNA